MSLEEVAPSTTSWSPSPAGTGEERRVFVPELSALPVPHPQARKYVLEGQAFATAWKVIVMADPGLDERAFASLRARLQGRLDLIDAQMSPYRSDSDLMRFNTAHTGTFMALPPMMMTVVRHALEIAELSEGAFDPGLLDAVEAWGFGARAVPEGLADTAGLTGGGWRNLVWQRHGLVRPAGLRLDLNAIAKGFAADELLDILKAEPGSVAALVEVGGELKGWGLQPDGLPWWVEIDGVDAIAALHEMAVATSGEAVRHFVHDGEILSHTLDAVTCAPVISDIVSATVFDPLCWRADALATALIVMGEARALVFAAEHAIPCLLRLRGGGVVLSSALEAWL